MTTNTTNDPTNSHLRESSYPKTSPIEPEIPYTKILSVTIPAIIGVAGLIAAIVGIAFMIHTGTFGSLSQSHSIAVITASGVAGLVAGIIAGLIHKSWPNSQLHKSDVSHNNMTHTQSQLNAPSNFHHEVPTGQGNVFRPLPPARRALNSWVKRPGYFPQAQELQDATDFQICASLEKTLVILEQRYLKREDVVLLDYYGDMYTAPSAGQPISFGLMPPTKLPDINTNEGKEATRNLITALEEHAIPHMRAHRIPKLFVPIPVEPTGHKDHGLLLVIELDDPNFPRMTVIDPLGNNTLEKYKKCRDLILELKKYVFPLNCPVSTAHNEMCQQSDNWSCGWQMLENIELLSNVSNVQEYIRTSNGLSCRHERKLPFRNPSKMKEVVAGYKQYGADAINDLKKIAMQSS